MSDELLAARRAKLEKLRAEGIDPFPHAFPGVVPIADVRAAQVVDASDLSTDVVQVGSIVHVKDEKTGKSDKYTIVGSAEANPAEKKLSNESPVGRALLGKKRNEIVSVQVPKGPARKLKITKIDVGL